MSRVAALSTAAETEPHSKIPSFSFSAVHTTTSLASRVLEEPLFAGSTFVFRRTNRRSFASRDTWLKRMEARDRFSSIRPRRHQVLWQHVQLSWGQPAALPTPSLYCRTLRSCFRMLRTMRKEAGDSEIFSMPRARSLGRNPAWQAPQSAFFSPNAVVNFLDLILPQET